MEPADLDSPGAHGRIAHGGAHIWYATYGSGEPVVLLHGGLGNADEWCNQVAALVRSGRRAVLIDSRGHGRSTRDARPFDYELMATDVLAVMDVLNIAKASFVGWSDGAIISIILAMKHASRVTRVFAFGGNTDLTGTKDVSPSDPAIAAAFARAAKGYAKLSATPGEFKSFSGAVIEMMQTQPNYCAHALAAISVPVTIVQSDNDEFIKDEHAAYVARSIPGATLVVLDDANHFAPLQKPDQFNKAMLDFLDGR
jgi:pimeloyl-ACP methyl ester carboxylesterase